MIISKFEFVNEIILLAILSNLVLLKLYFIKDKLFSLTLFLFLILDLS